MPIKIIDLTAETNPSDDDLIIIRDNLTGTTRKITRTAFFTAPPLGAGSIKTAMYEDGSITKVKLAADAKIGVRLNLLSSPSSITPNVDNYEIYAINGLNTNLTVNAPVGTPVDGQGLMFRFYALGTNATFSIGWNGIFKQVGVTLPTSLSSGKHVYINTRWNAPFQKWDVLGVGREA